MSIFVCGALHLDVIVDAPRLPRLDETLPGSATRSVAGGKGGNQAIAAARLGAQVRMAGCVGSDIAARTLCDALAAAGVDTGGIAHIAGASGMSVAVVTHSGEYGAVIVSAANLQFNAARVEFPSSARLLLLQNEIPEDANLALARQARARGARVILNGAPYRALGAELLHVVDILVVNQGEARALLGRGESGCSLEAMATDLGARGFDCVIVTGGATGLAICHDGSTHHHAAFDVTAISAHGAGDVFIGAFACGLEGAMTQEAAVHFGQAAAALTVATPAETRHRITRAAIRKHFGL